MLATDRQVKKLREEYLGHGRVGEAGLKAGLLDGAADALPDPEALARLVRVLEGAC